METLIISIHIFVTILMIVLVLIQSGKGAEISTTLAGSSQTVFGSSGGGNFFTRLTATMATIFMITSVSLTIMSSQKSTSIMEGEVAPTSSEPLPPTGESSKAPPAEAPKKK